jgi:hypothetical protein
VVLRPSEESTGAQGGEADLQVLQEGGTIDAQALTVTVNQDILWYKTGEKVIITTEGEVAHRKIPPQGEGEQEGADGVQRVAADPIPLLHGMIEDVADQKATPVRRA